MFNNFHGIMHNVNELKKETVNVRKYGNKQLESVPFKDFKKKMLSKMTGYN
jgi:threonyl-tRNA synthetase